MHDFLQNPFVTSLAYMQAFLLVLFRITGMFERLPVLGGGVTPRLTRVWYAFLVSCVVFPVVVSNQTLPLMPQHIGVFLVAAAAEFGLGLMMGFIVTMMLTGFQLGGRLVDDQMGFSLANVVDPMSNEMVSITSQLVFFAGTVLFIVMGGLNQVLTILAQSFNIVPLIGLNLSDNLIYYLLVDVFPQSLLLGVLFAAPAITVVFLSTVALGLVGKIMPEMNVFSFSFGIRAITGLIMLALSMRYLFDLVSPAIRAISHQLGVALAFARA